MRTRSLKKMPISNLSLIILNEISPIQLKRDAEDELLNRLDFTKSCDKFLAREETIIKQRGLDINNYLFSPNPTIQMLLELYFKANCDENLLFSELFLCGTKDNSDFLRTFIKEQLSNISAVIGLCNGKSSLLETLNILSDKLYDHNDNIFDGHEPNDLAKRLMECKIVNSGELLIYEEKSVGKQKKILLKQIHEAKLETYDKKSLSTFALQQL